MADAVTRDLITDRLTLDNLLDNFGIRGLWAYVTTAPRGTAIHDARCEGGWYPADHIAAESLYEHRKLNWRYGAVHFEGGADVPYPEPTPRPGVETPEPYSGPTWDTATIEDLASPQVLAMLKGE